jgi:sugar/nucleoside kinase (ribokinase family)
MAAVKLGARGAAIAAGEAVLRSPAPAITEADATGAGDAFDGALLAALAHGVQLQEALTRACAAQPGRWPLGAEGAQP